MGKRSVEGGDKQAKKTKKGKEFKSAETEKNSGFSLFRGKADVDLEDVFSKGVSALPCSTTGVGVTADAHVRRRTVPPSLPL